MVNGSCSKKEGTLMLELKDSTTAPLYVLPAQAGRPLCVAAVHVASVVPVVASVLFSVIQLPVAAVMIEVGPTVFVFEVRIATPILGSVVNSVVFITPMS